MSAENVRRNRRALLSTLNTIANQVRAPDEVVRALQQAWQLQTVAISENDPARVSYARNPQTRYDSERRVVVSLAKFLSRSLPEVYQRERWIDTISTRYRERIVSAEDFELLTGAAIVEAYRDEIGGHSCMTGNDCDKVEFYARNVTRVSLLVFKEKKARALVWWADCGTTLLDRVYSPSDATKETVRAYARKQGWVLRNDDGPAFPGWNSGESYQVSGLSLPDTRYVPWLDSFSVGSICGDTLTVCDSGRGDSLRCTDGGPYSDDRFTCCDCGDSLSEDDIRSSDAGDTYCEHCYCDRFAHCGRCCEETSVDDIREIPGYDYWCSYCFDDVYTICEVCDETVEHSDSVVAPIRWRPGGIAVDTTCCEECADDRAPECTVCGDRSPVTDCVDTSDGLTCLDCLPDEECPVSN